MEAQKDVSITITEKEAGQVAYEAYREACPVSKFTGDQLPPWEEIDEELKPYWANVERRVANHVVINCGNAELQIAAASHRRADAAEWQAEAMMCIGNALREFRVELACLMAMARDGEENVDIDALRRRFDGGV